ncbi:MAG: hypothetical protein ACPG4U_11385, partial [Pseudomonadales bacterium]
MLKIVQQYSYRFSMGAVSKSATERPVGMSPEFHHSFLSVRVFKYLIVRDAEVLFYRRALSAC